MIKKHVIVCIRVIILLMGIDKKTLEDRGLQLFTYILFSVTKDTTIKICDDRCLVVTSSFAFYVITFEPIDIEVQTCLAPQNDRLNLSFVKDLHVFAKKITRSGLKTAIYHSQILGNTLYINVHTCQKCSLCLFLCKTAFSHKMPMPFLISKETFRKKRL